MVESDYVPDESTLDLIKKAFNAKNNAYARYSGFKVGAVALTGDGSIFTGCNVENASYGLTMCAERVALFKAYSEGKRDIKTIVVIGETDDPISPCGACRQVILELAPEAEIVLVNRDMTKILKFKTAELLPYAFKL
ncbi:cytidine deaminase [Caldanaerobius fijiensis DSM 17918]|uniref:Cytidine deaminase n=1 Tax=Caldanaerobius fijiensis DSM 17918 TaxID=1121256 RepID=A0A1M4SQ94_9THEO|nr:cytidine deaminase [Caldanaerobius fijiensis]SHE34345.1 cytidine deaminase [Caldanaerobius fijiensis DSM 17918]